MDRAVEDLARALRSEAVATDERRLLVLAGTPERTREAAAGALDAVGIPDSETTVIGPEPVGGGERLDPVESDRLLGRTRTAVILDASDTCRPNALGRAVGALDGGGLLILLTATLDGWPDRRDGFDESLAVPPFGVDDVAGNFRRRLVALLRGHPGIAVFDADARRVERDGLTHPAPRRPTPDPTVPPDPAFPLAAYEACLTDDQVAAVQSLETLRDPGAVAVVEADRGRGKSSAAGLAAGSLAAAGRDVLVTAPQYRSGTEVFARAEELLAELDALEAAAGDPPRRLETAGGRVRYADPVAAAGLPDSPDAVIVDEAAALPVRLLERYLGAPAVAYATTIHGYEGAGRGFSVRFCDRLADADRAVTEVELTEPIRYAAGDPVEVWAFRALLLGAAPAVDQVVADAAPGTATYEPLSPDRLLADEHLLREAFGLLVVAHYRTEPDDLARLLDAPNVAVRALLHDGHVVSVALLAREGGLSADRRAHMYEGGRVRGNMIPDVLTTQLHDEAAGSLAGIRVMRIATHPAVRSRGLGSRLLSEVREEFASRVDWLGTGYGATPELVRFWRANGYGTIHLSTTRNDRSGEYSAIMLDPTSPEGRALRDRHAEWFIERIGPVLADPLDDLDPDVARAALGSVPATLEPDLSAWEWRLVAGTTGGAGTFDTAPGPFRELALAHLVDPAPGSALTERSERLLVSKVLQGRPWEAVAERHGYQSRRSCLVAFGDLCRRLIDLYGTPTARRELERFD